MSDSEVLIKVENVSKKFCRKLKRSLWYGVKDLSSELLGRSNSHKDLREDEFWALNDISFKLRRGEIIGLIGCNGAGKSTLLKLLNGLIKPDQGCITIRGRIGALIELGTGFNTILTGRENIYVNGTVLGLSKKEIDTQLDSIIEFSGISEFIDSPVQYYSSGMKVRLGFAVAAQLATDVLLVDEILAVGDISFQRKCLKTIKGIMSKGRAVILVSHNMDVIRSMCSKCVYLKSGKIVTIGETQHALKSYLDDQLILSEQEPIRHTGLSETTTNESIILRSVVFVSPNCQPINTIQFGEPVTVRFCYESFLPLSKLSFGFSIWTLDGIRITTVNSKLTNKTYDVTKGQGEVVCQIESWAILPGKYFVKATLYDADTDWRYRGIGYDGNPMQLLTVTTGFNQNGSIIVEDWGVVYLDNACWSPMSV